MSSEYFQDYTTSGASENGHTPISLEPTDIELVQDLAKPSKTQWTVPESSRLKSLLWVQTSQMPQRRKPSSFSLDNWQYFLPRLLLLD